MLLFTSKFSSRTSYRATQVRR